VRKNLISGPTLKVAPSTLIHFPRESSLPGGAVGKEKISAELTCMHKAGRDDHRRTGRKDNEGERNKKAGGSRPTR